MRVHKQAHPLLRLSWLRATSHRGRPTRRPLETGSDPASSWRPNVSRTSLQVVRLWPTFRFSAWSPMRSTWDRRTGSTCSSATPARTCRSSARRRQGPRVGHCFLEANFGANFCLKTRLEKPYKKQRLRSTIQKRASKKTIQKRASKKPYTKHCLSRSGPGRRSHRVPAIAF